MDENWSVTSIKLLMPNRVEFDMLVSNTLIKKRVEGRDQLVGQLFRFFLFVILAPVNKVVAPNSKPSCFTLKLQPENYVL